jgi:hypothetical protein
MPGIKQSKNKVHFMAPLTGKVADFQQIYLAIQSLGYELVTDHILKRTLVAVNQETDAEAKEMTKKLHNWIREADIVVFEVSTPNVSVGYEIGIAFGEFIPVILLYRKDTGEVPHGLKGLDTDLLQLLPYTDAELPTLLRDALAFASEQTARRVYLSFPHALFRYLTWVEKRYNLPHSTYVRSLVEKDMRDNMEYQAQQGNNRT